MSFERISVPCKVLSALAIAAASLLSAGHGLAAADVERAAGPRLPQFSYEEARDGSSRRYGLSAYAHKADRVTVRVIAQRGEGRDKATVRILVSDCAQDPPFYPLSCEIGL